jgi:hypothetical protein
MEIQGVKLLTLIGGLCCVGFTSPIGVVTLSSERALQNNKHAYVWKEFQGERKIDQRSQMGAWHQDRLADWLSVVN